MAWVRHGDESDTNPRLMEIMSLADADARSVNEVHGFIARCAAWSAKHQTDYVIEMGIASMYGGSESGRLIAQATSVGLMEWVEFDGARKLRIVEDPDYIHIRSKADFEWDRQRSRDNVDPNLKGPVLLRDGDQCRWCGNEVFWPGKPTGRKGTLDHLRPGEAGTVDTLVVCCWSCNGARQNDDTGSWDKYHELLPVPAAPLYGKWTKRYLKERGLLRSDHLSPAAPPGHGAAASEEPPRGFLPGWSGTPGSGSSTGASASIPVGGGPGAADHTATAGPHAGDSGTGALGASASIPVGGGPGAADHTATADPHAGDSGTRTGGALADPPVDVEHGTVDRSVSVEPSTGDSAARTEAGQGNERGPTGPVVLSGYPSTRVGTGKGRVESVRDGPGRDGPGGRHRGGRKRRRRRS